MSDGDVPPPPAPPGPPAPPAPAAPPAPTPPARQDGRRLFVGARVSVATASALASAAETLARRARDLRIDLKWVAPTNYHVTLKFLGWTGEAAIGAVRDALEAAARGTPRISFRTTRLGAFPSLEKASVLWAGVDEGGGAGGGPLAQLAARIDAAMIGLGFPAETRPFHAHVTLARLRETRPIKEVVLPVAEQMFGDTRIDSIILFESETKSSGSVYREVSRIEFKPALNTPSGGAERQTREVNLDASKPSSDPREGDETDDGWPRGQGPNY